MQHKYVVDAAQMLGFCCNDYADKVKTKTFEARVHEEGALYLPPVFESFGGFSRDLPIFFSKLINSVSLRYDDLRCIASKHLYESLSCALMKSIACLITSRFPVYFCSV